MNSYPETYKGWIILSISIHFVVIVFALLANTTAFNRPIVISNGAPANSINVDMVGLPNVLKKDIALLNKPVEVAVKPKPEEMILPDAKKTIITKLSVLEQLKSSIKEENTYLKKLKIIKGIKQSIGIGKVANVKDGATGAGAGDGTDNMPVNPYFTTLKEMIRTYWKVPTWIKTEGLNTIIVIKINSSGSVYEMEVSKPSGNADFDAIASNAVKNASPFPSPPVSLKDVLQNGVILSFP